MIERISDDDLRLLQEAHKQSEEAKAVLRRCRSRDYVAELRLASQLGALDFLVPYLHRKYGLGEQDAFDVHGRILRGGAVLWGG